MPGVLFAVVALNVVVDNYLPVRPDTGIPAKRIVTDGFEVINARDPSTKVVFEANCATLQGFGVRVKIDKDQTA